MSLKKRFQILRGDPPFATDINGAKVTAFDPVANRHLAYLKKLCDVFYREELAGEHIRPPFGILERLGA